MNGGNKSPWEQISSQMKQFEFLISDLKEYGKQIDEEFKGPLSKITMPEYTKKFLMILNTGKIGQIEVVPFILEEMLNNGMLKPLSAVQKKAVMSVLSI